MVCRNTRCRILCHEHKTNIWFKHYAYHLSVSSCSYKVLACKRYSSRDALSPSTTNSNSKTHPFHPSPRFIQNIQTLWTYFSNLLSCAAWHMYGVRNLYGRYFYTIYICVCVCVFLMWSSSIRKIAQFLGQYFLQIDRKDRDPSHIVVAFHVECQVDFWSQR